MRHEIVTACVPPALQVFLLVPVVSNPVCPSGSKRNNIKLAFGYERHMFNNIRLSAESGL